MRRGLSAVCSSLIVLVIAQGVGFAADGDLDLTFGIAGKVTTDFFLRDDGANSIAVQPDGRIVVAGNSNNSFALVRYNADGSLDQTFGVGGKVTTTLDTRDINIGVFLRALALQPDGKIVAAGVSSDRFDEYNGILVRYNSDGSLDNAFGDGGWLLTYVFYNAIVVQPDGKLIGAGYIYRPTMVNFALARYNSDGTADNSFGAKGVVETTFPGYQSTNVSSLAIQHDGKIVAGGSGMYAIGTNYTYDFVLARFNSAGSFDNGFGVFGKVVQVTGEKTPHSAFLHRLIILPEDKILAAGSTLSGPTRNLPALEITRYNNDGTPDSTFGTNGKATTDVPDSKIQYSDIVVQFDGKIVAAGYESSMVHVTRYNSDGSLDPSFGAAGSVKTILAAVGPAAATVQWDGKIVVACRSDRDFAAVRYNNAEPARVRFDPPSLRIGSSFTATFPGPDRTGEMYFDIQYRSPELDTDQMALNWQRGLSASHRTADTTAGTWIVTGVRAHEAPEDHTGAFQLSSTTLTVNPMVVAEVRIDGAGPFRGGDSFTATFTGTNLTDDAYFDVRFRSPGSNTEQVAVNWQRGISRSHDIAVGTATGIWTITGVWAHQTPTDHSSDFAPVSAKLNIASTSVEN